MRKINISDFFEIFNKAGIGEKCEIKGVNYLKLDAHEAFILSEICGGIYLGASSDKGTFSYKGLGKIFHSVGRTDFVVGLYDKGLPYFTPYKISQKYKWISTGYFYVLPIAVEKEEDFSLLLDSLKQELEGSEKIMVLRIETFKKGHGLENLLEYVFGKDFVDEGYLVESQSPLSHSLGSPDLVSIKSRAIKEFLEDLEIEWKGRFIIEFAMLRSFDIESKSINGLTAKSLSEDLALVCEAKVDNVDTVKRLRKYLSSGYFDYGVQIKTDYYEISDPSLLSLGFDHQWRIKKQKCRDGMIASKSGQEAYFSWYKLVIKLFLFSNFSEAEIESYSAKKYLNDPRNWLLEKNSDLVLKQMLKELKNGSI